MNTLHFTDELDEKAKEYADNTNPYCDADLEPIFSDLDLRVAFKAGYLRALEDSRGNSNEIL
jgi:hypothetical protein